MKDKLIQIRKEMVNSFLDNNPHADHGHDVMLLRILLYPIDSRLKELEPGIRLRFTLSKKDITFWYGRSN